MKNTGFGYLHFTMSAWNSVESLKLFSRQGAHLDAMKKSATIATETRTFTYEAEELPNWKEAKQLLFEKGKVLMH